MVCSSSLLVLMPLESWHFMGIFIQMFTYLSLFELRFYGPVKPLGHVEPVYLLEYEYLFEFECIYKNFSPVDQNGYLFKQCRSSLEGS